MHDAAETGQRGEHIALKLAQRLGWQPLMTNMPIAGGEADLVCTRQRGDRREALVAEVKTRRGGLPDAARVSPRQLARLRKMAKHYAEIAAVDRVEMAVILVGLEASGHSTRWLPVDDF